jgi:Uma2 family endonuclease
MATKVMVPLADYLSTSYEHDREYVHGEVVERGMPTYSHSRLQGEIYFRLRMAGLIAATELRLAMMGDIYRIPDVCAFVKEPQAEVPSDPPLVVVEIVSPDDRYSELKAKLREYQEFGVPYIWVVDPQDQTCSLFETGRLTEVDVLELEGRLTLSRQELFPKAEKPFS